MTEKNWKEIPIGGTIVEPGTSTEYKTGSWRAYKPIWNEDKCTNCFLCFTFCPEPAILVKDGKITGIDYDFCKGCGICAKVCPDKVQAIEMVPEF
ncbi:4Fe-4S binding protein [candidate division KSB1 bacterium]|nr:4Fe-4S binding protein [candidate division KSB1 bacterium]